MRNMVAYIMLAIGSLLLVLSYFFLAAPWGFPPGSVEFSDPRIPFAPTLFILGGVIMWLAAIVFEIGPKRRKA